MNNYQRRSARAFHDPEVQLSRETTQGKYMAWAENARNTFKEQTYIITNYIEAKKNPEKVSGYYREDYN